MGTPQFTVPALEALARTHEVVCVYSQPPRPAGRGKAPRKSAVQTRAEALGLVVRTPASLRGDPAEAAAFAALSADIAVVAAYGQILPQAFLDAPARGALNIHASLLPRWRGAAPVQRAIMAGDRETGISIMRMEAGLDTGPVLLREKTAIGPGDTAGDLLARLADMGARLILTALAQIDSLRPVPQPEAGATRAARIDKSEAAIDWRRPAAEICRQIHALSPAPGAWVMIGDERVRLLRARPAQGEGAPGRVLGGFTVACGQGAIEITQAQRPGRRPMPAAEILNGLRLPAALASAVAVDKPASPPGD